MTGLEIIAAAIQALALVVLYVFVGFGPGFVAGIMLANFIFARGKPTLMEKHKQTARDAAQHNAQWNPSHERWQAGAEAGSAARESEATEV